MVEPLRHRQTKGAATRMLDLTPPRHIPTLPSDAGPSRAREGRLRGKGRHCNRWKQTAAMGPESGRPAGQKILNSAHLESRSRLHLAGDKSLIDLAYQATAGSFPHLCVGKFAQAAIGNALKMIDVGSPPGALTPGSNFAALRAMAGCGCGRRGRVVGKPASPRGEASGQPSERAGAAHALALARLGRGSSALEFAP